MLALALLALSAAAVAEPADDPANDIVVTAYPDYPGVRVPDAELAELRGGFLLPNGIDVRMVVQSQTSLDGALLLRSVYRLETGSPTLNVFAPAEGQRIETERATSAGGGGTANLQVMFDRSTGVLFVPRNGGGSVAVSGMAWSEADAPQPDGLAALDLSGGPVQTAGGVVRLIAGENTHHAVLNGSDIDVRHIFGQGFGTVIENMGSNRLIDTATTISLDLSGTSPENLGSSLLRVDALALDATRGMIR